MYKKQRKIEQMVFQEKEKLKAEKEEQIKRNQEWRAARGH